MKKALSLLLAIVMVVGILPMTAMAANGTWTDQTVTGNTYTDTTADPNKSYEYTITDENGNTKTVTVVAAPAESKYGNSVKTETGVYYIKVNDYTKAAGNGYLLVAESGNDGNGLAVTRKGTNQAAVTEVKIVKDQINDKNNRIDGNYPNAEWFVSSEKMTGGYDAVGSRRINFEHSTNIEGEENQELGIKQKVVASSGKTKYEYSVIVDQALLPFIAVPVDPLAQDMSRINLYVTQKENNKDTRVYLNVRGTKVLADKNAEHKSIFSLYERKEENSYTVDTTGLNELLKKANDIQRNHKDEYEQDDAWKNFEKAIKNAKAEKNALHPVYETQETANAALEKIDQRHKELLDAMAALNKKPDQDPTEETVVPEIEWNRTLEGAKVPSGFDDVPDQPADEIQQGALVTDITFNTPGYKTIEWDWNKIKGLTTDPRMTIWDYNTAKQYSTATKAEGVIAATWNEWEITNNVDEWDDASVRKFAGTFTWPEGYTLNDKAVIASVNDANYKGIYDRIKKDPSLNDRFGDKKVIPVNDDMYVYIYKDGENPASWDAAKAAEHLVFWTGSSGKGIWSDPNNSNADWGRKTPPLYQTKPAVPAYHGVYPNNVDNTGNKILEPMDTAAMKLLHTDGWYTMVNTNTLMSTLNRLYPGQQLSGKMHIDIYAFDNSKNGGMDKLEIQFQKAPVKTSKVTVKYWLNDTTGTPLEETVISAAKVGDFIKLSQGTAVNELNHAKAKAIAAAKGDVSDGKPDYGEEGYQVKKNNNVINVVYTAKNWDKVVYYTYDFGVENHYSFRAGGIDLTYAELIDAAEGFGTTARHDQLGNIQFTYTPTDAKGTPARATLRYYRDNQSFDVKICVIPASNVLYEENFIQKGNATGWNLEGANKIANVKDNNDNIYGHTDAYQYSTGENGAWSTTMTAENKNSKDMTFTFNGIGLDVIGACGPQTGKMAIKLTNNKDNSYVYGFVVDTYYSRGDIYQVPLIHATGLAAGVEYKVTIRGIYANRAAAAATFADGMGGPSIDPDVYATLVDMGLTDEQIMDVEFINMQNELSTSTMALNDSTNAPATVASPASERVAVDSFRVYRSTTKAAAAYAENEQNLIYTNILDTLQGNKLTAFVEHMDSAGKDGYNITDYEKMGGPENEVYLDERNTIVIKADPFETIQVSLRSVGAAEQGTTALILSKGVNSREINLFHSTEMYYEFTAGKDGLVMIQNTTPNPSDTIEDRLLAVGNVKHQNPLKAVTEEDHVEIYAMLAEPASEFEVRFDLNGTDFAWADGAAATEVKSFLVSEAEGGVMAPEVVASNGAKLVGWEAVEIEATLGERDILTAQYLEENFDWTNTERIVTFRPVVEKPSFEVRFELNDDDLAWADGAAYTEVKSFIVSEEEGGVIAPEIITEDDEILVRWEAVEIATSLGEREVLTAQYLEENFDWTNIERVVTFRPVVEEIDDEDDDDDDEDEFEPEHFDIQMTVERGYSAKYVNVNVEASADVAYITVNGQRVDATNADWVEFGFDPYLIFVVDLEMGRNEEVEIEIVAYDANGVASDEFEVEE